MSKKRKQQEFKVKKGSITLKQKSKSK